MRHKFREAFNRRSGELSHPATSMRGYSEYIHDGTQPMNSTNWFIDDNMRGLRINIKDLYYEDYINVSVRRFKKD